MCGITGFWNFNDKPVDADVIGAMTETLVYRGPDGSGTYIDGPLALGHRRLSIIDLEGGRQPMSFDRGSLWITFNGEIFNYLELRKDLAKKGYNFATRSDTEVILAAYREYGVECVKRMNGQWAFAIWDAREKTLFLSRDRLGVRPLFYTVMDQTFVFASEIKALFAHPEVTRELDPDALRQVFTYWFPLPPKTVFKGIHELPPGHSLVVKHRKLDVTRYWQIDFSQTPTAVGENDEERFTEELCHLLLDSTRIRLRADVPVGAYLSGGLDSSVTTALAQQFVGSSLRTFSIGFEDATLDETSYQSEVVQRLGTKHQAIRCSSWEIGSAFQDVIWHAERPVLRTAPVPMFLLSRLVRDSGFKVVLTGEGSDEFLGGYDIYKEAKVRAFWAAQIGSSRRPQLLRKLYPYMQGLQKQSPAYLQSFFHVEENASSNPFFSHVPRWDLTSRTHVFFSPELQSTWTENQYSDIRQLLPDNFQSWDYFSRAQYLESAFLLPNYLLSSQGDRVAMANSVEGRYPFLDYRIAELSFRIPPKLKMKVLSEKYLLKRAFGDLVPDAVKRRPKQPYRAPDAASFFDSNGKARHDYVSDLLAPERLRANGIFEPGAVTKLVEKVRNGRATGFFENASLVGILSTQILYEKFITNLKENLFHAADRARSATVCH